MLSLDFACCFIVKRSGCSAHLKLENEEFQLQSNTFLLLHVKQSHDLFRCTEQILQFIPILYSDGLYCSASCVHSFGPTSIIQISISKDDPLNMDRTIHAGKSSYYLQECVDVGRFGICLFHISELKAHVARCAVESSI